MFVSAIDRGVLLMVVSLGRPDDALCEAQDVSAGNLRRRSEVSEPRKLLKRSKKRSEELELRPLSRVCGSIVVFLH